MKPVIAIAIAALLAMPLSAQDLDMGYTQSATDAARNGMLSSHLPHNRGDRETVSDRAPRRGATSAAEARATCAQGRRMRMKGDSNPNLVRLARLCAEAGF